MYEIHGQTYIFDCGEKAKSIKGIDIADVTNLSLIFYIGGFTLNGHS
jgi:hypothetical protein